MSCVFGGTLLCFLCIFNTMVVGRKAAAVCTLQPALVAHLQEEGGRLEPARPCRRGPMRGGSAGGLGSTRAAAEGVGPARGLGAPVI